MDIGTIIGCIVEFAAGSACAVLGLLIWRKQRVSLLHDYHYKNVKAEDLPAFCRSVGIGLAIIGAGICITGLLDLSGSSFWWAPMLSGFVIGMVMIIRTIRRYNGSIL